MKKTYTMSTKEQTTILIEQHLIKNLARILGKNNYSRFLLLCDQITKSLYGDAVRKSLEKLGKPVEIHILDAGEESKNTTNLFRILEYMVERGFDRKSAVVALGGGVVGDIATTVAGLYYRGIDCIQIPTTLLAQVDAAIGGKGAVDLRNYKNTVGIIRQPQYILIDPSLIKSLPIAHVRSGMGEVIKYAIALDRSLFELLEKNEKSLKKLLPSIIQRCVALKMSIVKKDPHEKTGERQLVNFGHTLGHAIELYAHFSHGEAIAIGMVFAIKVSEKMHMLKNTEAEKAIELLTLYRLPTTISKKALKKETIYTHMKNDKKAVNGLPTFVLLVGIGVAKVGLGVPKEIIDQTLEEILV